MKLKVDGNEIIERICNNIADKVADEMPVGETIQYYGRLCALRAFTKAIEMTSGKLILVNGNRG